MCTAISVTAGDNYFGRNLDWEHSFGEKVIITPRKYPFGFSKSHYAIIGMALPMDNYPLYFDATNEKGLSMAGLNFPGNAKYNKPLSSKKNIASFELISAVLSQCANVSEAEKLLYNANITDHAFKENLPPSPLHWIIADKDKSITLEQTEKGLELFNNPAGVLTNNPPFDMQMFNLNNYMALSPYELKNSFSERLFLKSYSRGMGAIGLPGDFSSMSRFVRACYVKLNTVFAEGEKEKINDIFHMLYSVYQYKGCVMGEKDFEYTLYTSCCNTDKGIYYYTTYYNSKINAIDMNKEDLSGNELLIFD